MKYFSMIKKLLWCIRIYIRTWGSKWSWGCLQWKSLWYSCPFFRRYISNTKKFPRRCKIFFSFISLCSSNCYDLYSKTMMQTVVITVQALVTQIITAVLMIAVQILNLIVSHRIIYTPVTAELISPNSILLKGKQPKWQQLQEILLRRPHLMKKRITIVISTREITVYQMFLVQRNWMRVGRNIGVVMANN